MKQILVILLLVSGPLGTFSQEKEFLVEGKIIDSKGTPVTDAYIINFRNHDKRISLANGVFDIWVLPSDSLIVSHISYYRKIVTVFTLLKNPIIQLETDTVNIIEVDVSPDHKTDIERARENLLFLSEMDVPEFTKIETESEPVNQTVIENNKLLRSEATSVTLVRFSPSDLIGKIAKKIKKRSKDKKKSSRKNRK